MAKVAKKIATRSSKKIRPRSPRSTACAVPVVVPGVEAPAVPASEPVQAEAAAPTPVSAAVPATDKRARKGRAAETAGRPRRRGPRAVEASPGSVAGKGGRRRS